MLRIKELLKQKNITAKELAERIGISEGALSKSITGNPTLERLSEIAQALDVPIAQLFESQSGTTIICPHCGREIKIKAEI